MSDGTRAAYNAVARAEGSGAPLTCEKVDTGASTQAGGMCHHAGRVRAAACHLHGVVAGCASGFNTGCGSSGSCSFCSSALNERGPEPVSSAALDEVAPCSAPRPAAWHNRVERRRGVAEGGDAADDWCATGTTEGGRSSALDGGLELVGSLAASEVPPCSAPRPAAWHSRVERRRGVACGGSAAGGPRAAGAAAHDGLGALDGGLEVVDHSAWADVASCRASTQSPTGHCGADWSGGAVSGKDAAGSWRAGAAMTSAPAAVDGQSPPDPSCSAGPCLAGLCHPACRAPWHPRESRCLVSRAGPEERAGWSRWRLVGSGAASGCAAGSARAIRLAQTHTVCCARCGDLVPLQKARKAARDAGRGRVGGADGCYGCGRHGRKSRRGERQGAMALAVLSGQRVLLEMPESVAPRVDLWMLPRAVAEAQARRLLAKYQPYGLGRWLTHSCGYGL